MCPHGAVVFSPGILDVVWQSCCGTIDHLLYGYYHLLSINDMTEFYSEMSLLGLLCF